VPCLTIGLARIAGVLGALLTASLACRARAIDFYEIQIYPTETVARGHVQVELHSNSVISASGEAAHAALRPYEVHETLETTYGLFEHAEIGQYFATAKFHNGDYEYAGSRTKLHFGIGDPNTWPVALGGNLELDYMRSAAEDNPLTFELRPILARRLDRLLLVANLALVKPFRGPGTHQGVTFSPSGMASYDLVEWLTPALEYYGDMGPLRALPGAQAQQHFLVPALNFHLLPRLELNLGPGFGLTRESRGLFLKSIVGWTF
jgi:hypothetical protein